MCGRSKNKPLKCWPKRRLPVSELNQSLFLKFLEAGIVKGGFETDDVLAALLPVLKQVLSAHQADLVAPLNGIEVLVVLEEGRLMSARSKGNSYATNNSHFEAAHAMIIRQVTSCVTIR